MAIAGCAIAVACDIVGARLSNRIGLFSDTISNLAAGPWDILSDLGIYAFVLGVLAVTVGLVRWRVSRWDWRLGTVLLVVLALDYTLIAAYEAYSTGEGTQIHYKLVYLMGVAFPLTVLLTAGQFWEIDRRLGIALYIGGALWALAAPVLFLVPTAWDGLYERGLAFAKLGWFVTMGVMIWRDPDIVRRMPEDERS
ncbi:DUF998 domain-containing protein [Erythrobacter sp. YJ-T3-07]|uniref:DUF998 domain-containing protein n=1 Tax=Erythrobacter sp. YJ-T3-07 TaxID=2793063 RepID=UPI0018D2E358|nr:DUF998 domain-containing protein [Erythrobacter sp. YJ-T3-07]